MKVGYIGLGAMGRALARHLPGVCEVTVYDLNPAAIAEQVELGANAADSAAAVAAESEVLFLCLPRSTDVETVLFGPNGVIDAISPGSVVIDQTSGIPSMTRHFADRLAGQGIGMLDAPVAGGVPGAMAGKITMMVSGQETHFERILPLLYAISPNVYYCSDRVGDGQALKSLNNTINSAYRIATLEIVAVGHASGLGIGQLAESLHAGEGRNFCTGRLLPAIAEGLSSSHFSLNLMVKDLNQAIALGEECSASLPLSDLARGLFQAAVNMSGPDPQMDDMVPFMEKLTGANFGNREATNMTTPKFTEKALLDQSLAAMNRLIVLENAVMAKRLGLDLVSIEPVLASGSAYSLAADVAFSAARGEAPAPCLSLGETVAVLDRFSAVATEHGLAIPLANTARALLQAALNASGPDANITAIVPCIKTSEPGRLSA